MTETEMERKLVLKETDFGLHRACLSVNAKDVCLSLGKGADIKVRDDKGQLPLQAFLNLIRTQGQWTKEHTEIIQLLVDHGEDVNSTDIKGWTALHWACHSTDVGTVKGLLSLKADVHIKNSEGNTCFRQLLDTMRGRNSAWTLDCTEITRLLVEHGADINTTDYKGRTALHMACYLCYEHAATKPLFDLEPDVMIIDQDGRTCISSLLRFMSELCPIRPIKYADIIQLLVERGADINSSDPVGMTPLHWACLFRNLVDVRSFLSLGADPEIKDMNDRTSLEVLLNKVEDLGGLWTDSYTEITQSLVEFGASIDTTGSEGRTPLHWACFSGEHEAVRTLLSLGAEAMKKDDQGIVPLLFFLPKFYNNVDHSAEGHSEVIQLLVDHGEDINAIDPASGRSCLHTACTIRCNKCIASALNNGAFMLIRDNKGRFPFEHCFEVDLMPKKMDLYLKFILSILDYVFLAHPMIPYKCMFFQYIAIILEDEAWKDIVYLVQRYKQQVPTLLVICAANVRSRLMLNNTDQIIGRRQLQKYLPDSIINRVYLSQAIDNIAMQADSASYTY